MALVPPQDFAFYADEAGISQDRFTVVGGLSMRSATAAQVYDSISEFRAEHRMRSELKWSKVSNQKLEEYRAFVDLFFALNNTNRIQFHAVVFDSHQWNHNKYNDGDADIGLSKLYYDLFLHRFVKRCGRNGARLFGCVDHRLSSTPLDEVRRMLNATAARDHGLYHKPMAQLVSRDSKKDCILQMNDVILGAVCAIRNGRHLLTSMRHAKKEVASYVLSKSGLDTFDQDSPRGVNRFTVWNKQPRPR